MDKRAGAIEAVHVLHDQVDRDVRALEAVHQGRLRCGRGCHDCCVDELTVFEVEAFRIQAKHVELLESGEPAPLGRCAFLDAQGGCRIYEDRPYVCRTQGLPLRWVEEVEDEDALVEYRDICPLNEAGEPIEELDESYCWTLGEVEPNLAAIQVELDGGQLKRVSLRGLFLKSSNPDTFPV